MSNDNNKYSIAERYRTVRKHLDSLGYKQSLSLDSLPLIELLLVDLAQTKESLKYFQAIAKDNLEACSQLQLAVDPFKCDNAKLVQECNQIHLDLIEAKETIQKQSNDYKKKIRKLESELSDLQLSFSKNLQRIKQLETESSNKSKKILELQGKCCKPIVNNVNLGNKKRPSYPLRRPILEAESFPRTISSSNTTFSTKSIEPYVFDFVSMADHRINSLSNEVTKLKEDNFLCTEHIESLKSQLKSKEKEISRLRNMLEGGRPCTSINKDHCCLRSEKINGYQRNSDNEELLCLQKAKLEQQLKEALNKQHDAMAQAMKLAERNEELEKELQNIDRKALAVAADCNSTVKENNRRVCRLQEKLEDVMTQVHVLENELTVQRREAQELRADLEACRLEKSSVQRTLETTLEEKKQMTDRINNLTIMELKLNDEIDRLRKENESPKNKINQLEKSIINLDKKALPKPVAPKNSKTNNSKVNEKQEKAEANAKKKFVKKSIPVSKCSEKSTGQDKRSESKPGNKECSCGKKQTDDTLQDNTDRLIHEKSVIIESLQNAIERIETERDHYKSEYVKFKDQLKRDTEKDNEGMWSQICELRAQMSEKEHAIAKLLREKKELCQEKFRLEAQLHSQQISERPSSPCNFCRYRSSPLSERKNGINSKIDRLERERDAARADIERLIEERDSLRERLKLATEAHVSEQRRLHESLDESESRLERIERERRELLIVQESRRAAISGLEDQLEDVKDELRRTKQELTEQRTQYFQLRALQDQTDEALSDLQGQLTQCENELSGALDRNKNLERQQLQLDNQIKELRQEISTHRSKIGQMDREKDQLLMDLDERTEKIAALEREIVYKEQQANGMEQQIRELSHTKQICIDQAADLDRQMRSMQHEMDNLQRQLQTATLDRENAIQENRRLADDLAAVSCEVRSMHKELEASKAESHDLKRQLQTYVAEVRRAEELLSRKENERTEMLNHFRSLSLEATVLENNNHSLETEAAEARGALQSARDQIGDLERQLSDKDCLIRGYEAQITELSQNVASLEIQLQQAIDQRLRVEDDLRTVRDLCMTLEQQKDCIFKRLEDNTDLKTQYEVQLARYKSEQDIFQDQMNKDHMTIDRLERLLEEARKETMNAQLNARELQCESTRLKEKIIDLQNKLSHETSEVRKYRAQAAEYSKQVSELRRQVTNERFERAKMREESRRCECQNENENDCQTQTTQSKGCHCGSKQSLTPKVSCWNQKPHRCNKTSFTRNQPTRAVQFCNDVSRDPCRSCACNSSSESNQENFKVQIRESSTTSNDVYTTTLVPGRKKSCTKNDKLTHCCKENQQQTNTNIFCKKIPSCSAKIGVPNFQNIQKVCYCMGKTKIGDLIASSKLNNNTMECKNLDVQNNLFIKESNKPPMCSGASSEGSIRCGRCGGTKNQTQSSCSNSSCWIAETLNLMNKILEERRKKVRCSKEKHIKLNADILKSKQQSFKYSLIETCTSNCTVSTQTLESIITVSEVSKAHLLKVLSEIQQYAQNIQEYFQAMNESIKLKKCSDAEEPQQQQQQQQQPEQSHCDRKIIALEPYVETPKGRPVSAQTDMLPEEQVSRISFSDEEISDINGVAFASTPRQSSTTLNSDADTTMLSRPARFESDQQTNASQSLRQTRDRSLESDLDSIEYLTLPRKIVMTESEKCPKVNESIESVEQQMDMEAIQEKIENLRRELFSDFEKRSSNLKDQDERKQ